MNDNTASSLFVNESPYEYVPLAALAEGDQVAVMGDIFEITSLGESPTARHIRAGTLPAELAATWAPSTATGMRFARLKVKVTITTDAAAADSEA
ncbi:hypothetical protein [Pseudacidovorax intermedius]|uniref:Uncharacterized protein n=1 Tax=Pseudacidovorax intermedius TaxID=433924 RepID=A0A147GR18_9BURK|nr:hypothetical protein [Pseudacidovorax intermedius]KTT17974.1 hypothetical protein NS331_16590 [Pseudacidovorax intermedius]